jgi:hypothetical protein
VILQEAILDTSVKQEPTVSAVSNPLVGIIFLQGEADVKSNSAALSKVGLPSSFFAK